MEMKYARRRAPRWAWIAALFMLVTTDGVTHTPVAVTDMPPKHDIFAESDAYERFMGRWSRRAAPLLVRFVSVDEGDSVLDVGSGTGALAFALADAIPAVRVTGVDPSDGYVRYAQARTPDDRVRFFVGDAQALRIPAASVDKTLSLLVMNFIPDPVKALREMVRVTRPGGVVAAAVWDYGEGMEMLRVFWDEAVALDSTIAARDERNMPLCRQGELAALWRANGLQRVEELPITIELTFASFDDYWRPFLGGQGPAGAYAASLSEPRRAALEARIHRRLLGTRQDGPFTLQGRAWAVKGVVPAPTRDGATRPEERSPEEQPDWDTSTSTFQRLQGAVRQSSHRAPRPGLQ